MMYGFPNFRSPHYKYRYPEYEYMKTPVPIQEYPNFNAASGNIENNRSRLEKNTQEEATNKDKKKEEENSRGSSSLFNLPFDFPINLPEEFEIFGIKLHFDDILILCLLLFLYTEGVKDEWLFISLILLLLS